MWSGRQASCSSAAAWQQLPPPGTCRRPPASGFRLPLDTYLHPALTPPPQYTATPHRTTAAHARRPRPGGGVRLGRGGRGVAGAVQRGGAVQGRAVGAVGRYRGAGGVCIVCSTLCSFTLKSYVLTLWCAAAAASAAAGSARQEPQGEAHAGRGVDGAPDRPHGEGVHRSAAGGGCVGGGLWGGGRGGPGLGRRGVAAVVCLSLLP